MIGRVKYIGKSFGVEQLTDGKVYDVLDIDDTFIRIIDDSGEDYLYSTNKPSSLDNSSLCGKWIIVEDKNNKLTEYIKDAE